MDILSLPLITIITLINWFIFKKPLTAILFSIVLIVIFFLVLTAGNTFAQRTFYGKERLQKFDAIIAMPSLTLGDALSPTMFLKAHLNDEGNYSCDHIRSADGSKPIFGVVGNDLICCNHSIERDGYMAPFKILNGELHVMCGTFPYENEVILDKEASSKLPFIKEQMSKEDRTGS